MMTNVQLATTDSPQQFKDTFMTYDFYTLAVYPYVRVTEVSAQGRNRGPDSANGNVMSFNSPGSQQCVL